MYLLIEILMHICPHVFAEIFHELKICPDFLQNSSSYSQLIVQRPKSNKLQVPFVKADKPEIYNTF